MKYSPNHPAALEITQALSLSPNVIHAMDRRDDVYVRCFNPDAFRDVSAYCRTKGYIYADKSLRQARYDKARTRNTEQVTLHLNDARQSALSSLPGDTWQEKIYSLIDNGIE